MSTLLWHRIESVLNEATKKYDEVSAGEIISVGGHDIIVDPNFSDEGFWLAKRTGQRNRSPRLVQQAEVIESKLTFAKIVFHEAIPRGKYLLFVRTRCGEGKNYRLRQVGHPVTVI